MTLVGEIWKIQTPKEKTPWIRFSRGGNSQANVLLEDGTLESFSKGTFEKITSQLFSFICLTENTKGEAGDGESLRFKDREGAMMHLLCPFFFIPRQDYTRYKCQKHFSERIEEALIWLK